MENQIKKPSTGPKSLLAIYLEKERKEGRMEGSEGGKERERERKDRTKDIFMTSATS